METTLDQLRNDQLKTILNEQFGAINAPIWARFGPCFHWTEIGGGEQLFAEGEPSDQFYLVVSGRLQVLKAMECGGKMVLGEIGRGESIGEMALLTGDPRSATIVALRDSALVRVSKPDFDEMLRASENMVRHIYKNLITRLNLANSQGKKAASIQTIAVVGIHENVGIAAFCRQLRDTIARRSTAIHLDSAACHAALGYPESFSQKEWHNRLTLWLNDQEMANQFNIYQADTADPDWMRRCLRQADMVFLLANATMPPDLTEIERQWLDSGTNNFSAPQHLVLQYPAHSAQPKNTMGWLKNRAIERHFHLKKDDPADFARLARFVQGRAIGLVFAGGGARGLSHLGIFRAMAEQGMPIDMLGGTSAGAIIGGMIAHIGDLHEVLKTARSVALHNPTKGDFDLFPVVSLLSGKKFQRSMEAVFGPQQIEDLWLDYFCVSSNLTDSSAFAHRSGLMSRAIRASAAIPGVFPPIVFGNDLHVDGGVINNLPIDLMRQFGAGRIIAADLESQRDFLLNFEETPGAKAILKQKIMGKKPFNAPSLVDILMKSSVVGSNQKARELGATADLFFMPDLKNISFAAWESFDEIVGIGYEYARRKLENVNPADWV